MVYRYGGLFALEEGFVEHLGSVYEAHFFHKRGKLRCGVQAHFLHRRRSLRSVFQARFDGEPERTVYADWGRGPRLSSPETFLLEAEQGGGQTAKIGRQTAEIG
jgi:hypothetical protein